MEKSSTSAQSTTTTIRGMAIPAQWNARFEVTGILVACRDERELRVENFESFPELRSFSQKEAFFTGIIHKKDGMESILLESFTPIENVGE
ncbi:hypothetical protein [Maridesulfovibrio sp.]|uniref:hypothetical protein n=1 Tax=Maridesulfovibrio sp. TaxID=2795000 RepID=UPI002A189BED|nr:hypothetical protein [Maridesulfovibrio sp.]